MLKQEDPNTGLSEFLLENLQTTTKSVHLRLEIKY